MTKPVLLDIGCCQGGATYGYQKAGFYVIGVDVSSQPRYQRIMDEFVQADGLEILQRVAAGERICGDRIHAVHTSWPCQGYTECQRIQGNEHPRLIEPGRELLQATGLPYVQENVDSADTRAVMLNPIQLCGSMFGLRTYRHRLFESNIALIAPEHPAHVIRQQKMGRPFTDDEFYQAVGNFSGVQKVRDDLGFHWMNRDGLRESIPWQYAEYVGQQIMMAL